MKTFKCLIFADPLWFRINTFSDQLRLSFSEPNDNELNVNCDINVTVLFLKT